MLLYQLYLNLYIPILILATPIDDFFMAKANKQV